MAANNDRSKALLLIADQTLQAANYPCTEKVGRRCDPPIANLDHMNALINCLNCLQKRVLGVHRCGGFHFRFATHCILVLQSLCMLPPRWTPATTGDSWQRPLAASRPQGLTHSRSPRRSEKACTTVSSVCHFRQFNLDHPAEKWLHQAAVAGRPKSSRRRCASARPFGSSSNALIASQRRDIELTGG